MSFEYVTTAQQGVTDGAVFDHGKLMWVCKQRKCRRSIFPLLTIIFGISGAGVYHETSKIIFGAGASGALGGLPECRSQSARCQL
jgi:hypothetical protein